MGDLPREDVWDDDLAGAEETGAVARNDGFLCVISDLSTLRSPEVTSEPREIWSNTAPMSEELDWEVGPLAGIGGGGGGPSNEGKGGGGGGAADEADGCGDCGV